MTLWIILIIWIIGMPIAYAGFIKNWDNSTFEKVWATIFWPLSLILYGIHAIHNA